MQGTIVDFPIGQVGAGCNCDTHVEILPRIRSYCSPSRRRVGQSMSADGFLRFFTPLRPVVVGRIPANDKSTIAGFSGFMAAVGEPFIRVGEFL